MAKKTKEPIRHAYNYIVSDIEAKYKIFRNTDAAKYQTLYKALQDNMGYCPCKVERIEENRCMCKQFRERDSEGYCKCNLYYKEARTPKQAALYQNTVLEVNEKKEKEIEKQITAEEKKKSKET